MSKKRRTAGIGVQPLSPQSIHYIVDGYNVLHSIPSLKTLMDQEILAAREQLIDAIGRLSYRKKFRCTLVFDGVKPTSHITPPAHSPVHVVYSSPLSADAKIRSMIEQSQGRPQLVIVTSDRNILAFARACSCKSHTSKYFVSMLYESDDAGEEKEQSTLSRKEIEEWLKLFGGK